MTVKKPTKPLRFICGLNLVYTPAGTILPARWILSNSITVRFPGWHLMDGDQPVLSPKGCIIGISSDEPSIGDPTDKDAIPTRRAQIKDLQKAIKYLSNIEAWLSQGNKDAKKNKS